MLAKKILTDLKNSYSQSQKNQNEKPVNSNLTESSLIPIKKGSPKTEKSTNSTIKSHHRKSHHHRHHSPYHHRRRDYSRSHSRHSYRKKSRRDYYKREKKDINQYYEERRKHRERSRSNSALRSMKVRNNLFNFFFKF
jgi:hypothetical protein